MVKLLPHIYLTGRVKSYFKQLTTWSVVFEHRVHLEFVLMLTDCSVHRLKLHVPFVAQQRRLFSVTHLNAASAALTIIYVRIVITTRRYANALYYSAPILSICHSVRLQTHVSSCTVSKRLAVIKSNQINQIVYFRQHGPYKE